MQAKHALPCIAQARRFDPARHVPFVIEQTQVGWIRRQDCAALGAWPAVFDIAPDAVSLAGDLRSLDARSRILAEVIAALAEQGRIPGWRNEIYAIRNAFDAAPLALIERAASRFFGTLTYGVNVNGLVATPAGNGMWIATRSLSKPTHPGMLDTLVGGGIGWGYGVFEAMLKESWEESGVPRRLAESAQAGGILNILQELPEGTHAEQLYVYDLTLPADFKPENQDGEVSAHRLMTLPQVMDAIRAGELTVDASLSALDHLLRAGAVDPAECEGIDILYRAP